MAEKRQRINVNIYRASHNAEESQYIFDVEEELKSFRKVRVSISCTARMMISFMWERQ